MLRFLAFSLFLNAGIFAAFQTADEPRRFVVQLPAEWQESKLRLVIDGVRIPGNVPLKLRVTTIGEDEKEVALGSIGIEAIGPNKSATRSLRALRLDVTRPLKRFLERQHNPSKVDLRIQAVDGRNNPIRDLKWSVEDVRLETQPSDPSARLLRELIEKGEEKTQWSFASGRAAATTRLSRQTP